MLLGVLLGGPNGCEAAAPGRAQAGALTRAAAAAVSKVFLTIINFLRVFSLCLLISHAGAGAQPVRLMESLPP